jgi:polysaccharide export outer membrane protein
MSGIVAAEEGADRRIETGDVIIIEVFDEKTLSVERRVQKSGTITYPLLGEVDVAGKTTAEIASILKEKLGKDYLVNPDVTVNVKQYRLRTVSVIGKVMKGGPVPLPEEERMSIIEAIAQAGGFQPTANENKIEFSRKGKTTAYRYRDLIKVTEDSKKIWLEPGDVIDVKESIF